ncbi:MAG: FkbM family methyltransferase [Gemmataceae bacterium]|nr:FkbM family methyltransferase [Gemmataceae bacterium]
MPGKTDLRPSTWSTRPPHGTYPRWTGLASFDKHLLVKQIPAGTPIVEVTVPAVTLDSLLRTHDVRRIDLLQIDTEGFDYEVIQMLDFATVRPAIIHYEHTHLSDPDRRGCEKLLSAHGYRLHCAGMDTTAVIQP